MYIRTSDLIWRILIIVPTDGRTSVFSFISQVLPAPARASVSELSLRQTTAHDAPGSSDGLGSLAAPGSRGESLTEACDGIAPLYSPQKFFSNFVKNYRQIDTMMINLEICCLEEKYEETRFSYRDTQYCYTGVRREIV
jgi:hypothetical protein